MLKLALVRARYSPFGGAERFVNLALDALIEEGVDVTVLARQWDASEGLPSHLHMLRCDPFYLGSTWRDQSFARAVTQVLRKSAFDLVQSHERIAGTDIYRAGDGLHRAWLRRRAPTLSALGRFGLRFNLHHRYLCKAEDRLFADARLKAVICNSMMVRDEIVARYPQIESKLHVIYNGVDLERFTPQLQATYRVLMRDRLNLSTAQPVVLFMGSGFARKGLRFVLEALAQGDAQIHLIVAGGDKEARRYQDLAAQLGLSLRCRFVGPVEDPRPYYGMADALVLPSIYDPFPNAALEALASGLPIIVSDGCGAREVVDAGKNGWVTPAGDASALAGVLGEWHLLHTEPYQDVQMRRSARMLAEKFGAKIMAQSLLELYQNLLGHRGL